jgi:hypothetical protein
MPGKRCPTLLKVGRMARHERTCSARAQHRSGWGALIEPWAAIAWALLGEGVGGRSVKGLAGSATLRSSSSFSEERALIRTRSETAGLTDTRADLDLAVGTAKLRRRQSREEVLAERVGRMGDDMTATSSTMVHPTQIPCLKVAWTFIAPLRSQIGSNLDVILYGRSPLLSSSRLLTLGAQLIEIRNEPGRCACRIRQHGEIC